MVEGRHFFVLTDHKPLTFAFSQKSDQTSPRRYRHLDLVGQFTTDIRHISGTDNVVADALSRFDDIAAPLDCEALAASQQDDSELQELRQRHDSGLLLRQVTIPGSSAAIFCDVSTTTARPFLTAAFRKPAFDAIHGLSHPGAKATTKLVSTSTIRPRTAGLDNSADFVRDLRQHFQALRPVSGTRHSERKIFVFKDLATASHVFVRHDAVRRPLQHPYDGPFEVVSRPEKHFNLRIHGANVPVSIDRLKPAYIVEEDIPPPSAGNPVEDDDDEGVLLFVPGGNPPPPQQPAPPAQAAPPVPAPQAPAVEPGYRTRSGRHVSPSISRRACNVRTQLFHFVDFIK